MTDDAYRRINTAASGPFCQSNMADIFQVHAQYNDRLKTRESTTIEFKKAFSLGSLEYYARTCVAFANNRGGYIVFGVNDSPHKIIGLQDNRFEELDPVKITTFFNEHFSPEITWDLWVHKFSGLTFGLVYVHECKNKPVICTKSAGKKQEVKEGEIYYRYRAQSRTIRYPELRQIIEERRQKEQDIWLEHLKRIARIGVSDAAVFDPKSGLVSGPERSFLIDESLLPSLNLIKEGEFDEVDGAPTLKVVGEVHPISHGIIQPTKEIVRRKIIHTADIVHAFLDQTTIDNPLEYLDQICYESAGYLPFYFLLRQARISPSKAKELVEKSPSRAQGKTILLKRLNKDRDLSIGRLAGTDSSLAHANFRKSIISKKVPNDATMDLVKIYLKAIRTMNPDEVNQSYLFPHLKNWFDIYYGSRDTGLAQAFRETFCYLDSILNPREKLKS